VQELIGSEEEFQIGCGNSICDSKCAAWTEVLTIQGTYVVVKIETGADVSIIRKFTNKTLKVAPGLLPTSIKLSSAGGKQQVKGAFTTTVNLKKQFQSSGIVVDSNPAAAFSAGQ